MATKWKSNQCSASNAKETEKMFSKVLGLALLAAFAQAQHHEASSYISYTQNVGHGGIGLGGGSSLGGLGGLGGGHEGSSYISYSHGHGGLGGAGLGLGGLGHAVPIQVHSHHEEHHAPANYQFKYGVEDKHTGDIKQQEETRNGDVVKGSYSLHEPDGTILTVHYTADKHSGFNAVVDRHGHAVHPQHSHHH